MKAYRPPVMADCVIDLSHHNTVQNPAEAFREARAAGIVGLIHKATQGTGYIDPKFAERRAAATEAGLLFGAYHFCDGSDPMAQADHFLSVVGDPAGVLLALDVEQNPVGSQATIEMAALAASRIYRRLGRWPVIYTGRYGPTGDGRGLPNTILAGCDLWLPSYGSNPVCPPGWSKWAMWQHTDGAAGSNRLPVSGIGWCDRSYFAGTEAELRAWWVGKPAMAEPIQPVLRRGHEGEAVAELQRRLMGLGHDAGPDDGVFGPRTEGAVKSFQTERNLIVDGIVGPQTWSAMASAEAGHPPEMPAV